MISFELWYINQVSVHNDKGYDTFEIFKEERCYNDLGSIDEIKEDQGDDNSSIHESDGESLQATQNLYDTHVCFDNIFSSRLECAYSYNGQRKKHIVDFMDEDIGDKPLWNLSHHIDDGILIENQILKHLEEMVEEVIFGAHHCKMVVMSSPQSIMSHYEPNVFLRKYSLSNNTLCGSCIYEFDEVCSLSMNLTKDTNVLHFGFHDQIEIWLEK